MTEQLSLHFILSQKVPEFVPYKSDRILDKLQDGLKIQLEARLGRQELIKMGQCQINTADCSTEWFTHTFNSLSL